MKKILSPLLAIIASCSMQQPSSKPLAKVQTTLEQKGFEYEIGSLPNKNTTWTAYSNTTPMIAAYHPIGSDYAIGALTRSKSAGKMHAKIRSTKIPQDQWDSIDTNNDYLLSPKEIRAYSQK